MKTLKGLHTVFCDASYFIALFSKKDIRHNRALELFKEIKEEQISINTSWYVVSESMTILRYQYGYTEALSFNRSIDLYKIHNVTESQLQQAVAVFNLFNKDKKISFVDALTRVLINSMLSKMPALSFDSDFKTLGLTVISWQLAILGETSFEILKTSLSFESFNTSDPLRQTTLNGIIGSIPIVIPGSDPFAIFVQLFLANAKD